MHNRPRVILRTLGVVLALVLVVYAGLTVWSFVALRRAYTALARDGRPMRAAEVIPLPAPAADNAAPLYEEAVRLLNAERIGDRTLLQELTDAARAANATNATPSDVTRFRELVTRPEAQHALELVVRAGERKACRFDLDYAAGPGGIAVSNLSETLTLSKVVRGEVSRLADVGESTNAWRLAIAGLELAQAKRAEPFLISQLVTIALDAIAEASVRRLCTAAPPTQEQSDRILAALTRMDQPAEFQRMLDGERLLYGEWSFAHLTTAHNWWKEERSWEPRVCRWFWRPVLRLDHAAYLRIMRDAATTPLSRSLPPIDVSRCCSLTRAILPALDSSRTSFATSIARVRCTEAGLAVLKHRQACGDWPVSLASCMAAVPDDPFDGQLLRYRVTEKGFVVYSIGKDRKDNGGTTGCDEAWNFTAR